MYGTTSSAHQSCDCAAFDHRLVGFAYRIGTTISSASRCSQYESSEARNVLWTGVAFCAAVMT
jgi:hypothetical protein